MDRHSAYVALSRHREGVQLHYGRDDFADQRQLTRTLNRERAKDMASDYPMVRDRDAEARAFADRRGLAGEIRLGETLRTPRRGMFDGLKLPTELAKGTERPPARADRVEDRAFARALERTSRSAEAVLQARASGRPVLEHQKVALERATQALDRIRPGATRDLAAAMQRDRALLFEAAAGRSGPLLDAMAQEARMRADPALRADRFVERWRQLSQDRERLYRADDMAGREKAGKEMAGMAKSLERDPQVESILRGRTRELGLEIGMNRARVMGGGELGRQLAHELGIDRDRGLGR